MTTAGFWISLLALLYVYFFYPVLLILRARLCAQPVRKALYEPEVSIILSLYNEEKTIARKIENLLELDYPAEKLEILIGSDGSTDSTDAILESFRDARLRFRRFAQNRGKPQVLNSLISEARGSILVFTDARQRIDPAALRRLAENFADPYVGCVSGELFFEDEPGSGVARGMGLYWNYEKLLRKKESQAGSMLGATGALYAVRSERVPEMPGNILADDLFIPLAVSLKGYRSIFEEEARAYDAVSLRGSQEFTRKVRTLAGNYQILEFLPGLRNPFLSFLAWQFWSHKVLRLFVPFFLIVLFSASCLLAQSPFYRGAMGSQMIFYALAVWGWRCDRTRTKCPSFCSLAFTFCLLNAAAAFALPRFLRKEKTARWRKAYD